jgi:5-methylcytosine-specific restriction protein A
MPGRPKRPCRHPGCPNLTDNGYCERHKRRDHDYDRYRGTAAQRGYDSRWRKYRIVFLRQHPLCVECEKEGRLTPATVVDHIKPHKGDPVLFWDPNNHQPMCEHHHNAKTAREDMGAWSTEGRG